MAKVRVARSGDHYSLFKQPPRLRQYFRYGAREHHRIQASLPISEIGSPRIGITERLSLLSCSSERQGPSAVVKYCYRHKTELFLDRCLTSLFCVVAGVHCYGRRAGYQWYQW